MKRLTAILLFFCLTLAACGSVPPTPTDRFYRLQPTSVPAPIKAVHGPLPQAPLMPTGGVSADNVGEWFAAGAVALGVGGSLTAGAKTGDYAAVTAAARLFVEKIKAARNG